MTRGRTNPDFLNGVPELVVLRLLAARPMYGYELVKAIEQTSGQGLEFGEGSIYPVLHRLEAEGALASRRVTVGGRSRVVYRVTSPGKRKLAAAVDAWRAVVQSVERVLNQQIAESDEHGRPALA
ncbi:MAG: PadR family transcriptional regulator [Pirellulales bacterium]